MVRLVVGLILHGGSIGTISHSSQCSMTGVTKAVVCGILPGAYKRQFAANRK